MFSNAATNPTPLSAVDMCGIFNADPDFEEEVKQFPLGATTADAALGTTAALYKLRDPDECRRLVSWMWRVEFCDDFEHSGGAEVDFQNELTLFENHYLDKHRAGLSTWGIMDAFRQNPRLQKYTRPAAEFREKLTKFFLTTSPQFQDTHKDTFFRELRSETRAAESRDAVGRDQQASERLIAEWNAMKCARAAAVPPLTSQAASSYLPSSVVYGEFTHSGIVSRGSDGNFTTIAPAYAGPSFSPPGHTVDSGGWFTYNYPL